MSGRGPDRKPRIRPHVCPRTGLPPAQHSASAAPRTLPSRWSPAAVTGLQAMGFGAAEAAAALDATDGDVERAAELLLEQEAAFRGPGWRCPCN